MKSMTAHGINTVFAEHEEAYRAPKDADAILILSRVDRPETRVSRWQGRLFLHLFSRQLRNCARAFTDRGYERSFLSSHAYHEMHAMIDRVFPQRKI